MANNPYLEDNDNPYLKGFDFSSTQNSNNKESGPEPEIKKQPQKTNKVEENQTYEKEFDILDASTYINTDPKKPKEKGEPYKEIKNPKEKKVKIKEKKKFNLKSFFIGFGLAIVFIVTSLGLTIASLYNSLTLGKIQNMLNTKLTDGDINNYTIKDLVDLAGNYNTLTVGNLERLLGFDINSVTDEVYLAPLLDELTNKYITGKSSYKEIRVTDIQKSLTTILDEITIDHFAYILSEENKNGDGLMFFKYELLNKGLCDTIEDCFEGSKIKLKTFFGEALGDNLNKIKVKYLVENVFKIDEDSTKFEKFIYEAFNECEYGLQDLVKNYNEVIDSSIQVKDLVNSFIDENTEDAFLNILKDTYSSTSTGITSFIDNFSEEFNKIKLHTIVTNLWPDMSEHEDDYDGFIKLIYDIYSDPSNNIGVMDFANNISDQLDLIKISNVVESFFGGDSKLEQLITSVYGDSNVGFGDFIDNFMSEHINEISIKNIIETFLESDNSENNKLINLLKEIYTQDKFNDVGISEFFNNFFSNSQDPNKIYSKEITVQKLIELIVPENEEEREPFENFIVDTWGENTTDIFTAFSDIKEFLNQTTILDFTNKLYSNDIITVDLYKMILASICENPQNILDNNNDIIYENIIVLDEFKDMGTYTYFSDIKQYIENITLQEILDNAKNLPEIVVKLIELVGEKGILEFIENPLALFNSLTIREISEVYFETSDNTNKQFRDENPKNSIPDSFDNILNIILQEEIIDDENPENNTPQKLLGEVTLEEFLNDRETYLNKIKIDLLLEFLKDIGTIQIDDGTNNGGMHPALYNFLKTEIGQYYLIDFKDNASIYLQKITMDSLITTLEAMGSLDGLKNNNNSYLIDYIKTEFGDKEIKDFADNFTTYLNTTTIKDFREYMEKSEDFQKNKDEKTYKILIDIIDTITEKIENKDENYFNLYLTNAVNDAKKSNTNFKIINTIGLTAEQVEEKEQEEINKITEAYEKNTLETYEFLNNDVKEFVLNTEKEFNSLELNTYFNKLFKNIRILKIADFCKIFEVDLEADENETLSIYGKLLNKIKDNTLQEFINDSETIVEEALKDTINKISFGEIKEKFDIDLLNVFKCYNKDTTLETLLNNFDKLTIADFIDSTNSHLLNKLSKINITKLGTLETVINDLLLGDVLSINKLYSTINIAPTLFTDIEVMFDQKYILVEDNENNIYGYYTYNSTNQTFDKNETEPTGYTQHSKLTSTSNDNSRILSTIYGSIDIFSTINLDRYYKVENSKTIQIQSDDPYIESAETNSLYFEYTPEEFSLISEFVEGHVYKVTEGSKYYRFDLANKTWVEKSEKVAIPDIDYPEVNVYDIILSENYKNLLPGDAIKINDMLFEYTNPNFVLIEDFTQSNKLLTLLKHVKIGELGSKLSNLTIGELFGENSKIVKLCGGNTSITLENIENNIKIDSLTLQELGTLGLLDVSKVKNDYLNKTIQEILNEVLVN